MVHMGRRGTPELPYCKPDILYCIVFGYTFIHVSLTQLVYLFLYHSKNLHTTCTSVMNSSILVLCYFQALGFLSKEAGNGPRVTVDSFGSPHQVFIFSRSPITIDPRTHNKR